MAEKSQHQYSLRNLKTLENDAAKGKIELKEDNGNGKDGKDFFDYTLNVRKALQKKAAKTKDEAITHELKSHNVVVKCNTAAYEIIKNNMFEILAAEMEKICKNVKVKYDPKTERKGVQVSQVISVETSNREECFIVNMYHTTSSIMVNGKGFGLFYSKILTKIYDLVIENEEEISKLNDNIWETLKPKGKCNQNDNDIKNRENTSKNKDLLKSSGEQNQQSMPLEKFKKSLPKIKEEENIVSTVLNNAMEECTGKSTEDVVNNDTENKIVEEGKKLRPKLEFKENITTINKNESKVIVTGEQYSQDQQKGIEDQPKEQDNSLLCEKNVIQDISKLDEKKSTPIQDSSLTKVMKNEQECSNQSIACEMEENEVDFHTDNNQELQNKENEIQQKGTKRLRVEDEEDEEIIGEDRTDRKERRVVENDTETGSSIEEKEGEDDKIMIVDSNLDHDYLSESKNEQKPVEGEEGDSDDDDKPCMKCKRFVRSNAVICEKCNGWIHFNCLRVTDKQLQEECPGDYFCKDCIEKQNNDEINTHANSKEENILKPPKLIHKDTIASTLKTEIIVTDENIQNESQIDDVEIENKKLNVKIKELQSKCKEYKKEIQIKDNMLSDRKIEVARLNATNENNRKEINMLNHKCEALSNNNVRLEQTLQNEKSDWDANLSKQLQKKYEEHEYDKMVAKENYDKMNLQYITMMKENNERISKKDREATEREAQLEHMKKLVKEAENSSQIINEKNEIINNLQKSCNDLRKSVEEVTNVNYFLESEIHAFKASISESEINEGATTSNIRQSAVSNYQTENKFISSTKNDHTENKSITSKKPLGKESKNNDIQSVPLPKDAEPTGKKCFACGDSNHEIKDCGKKVNLFVKFTGDHWINNWKLDQVFGRLGNITSKRIMRDREGNYTRSAMICYQNEEEARKVVEIMADDQEWMVRFFNRNAPKQQRNKEMTGRNAYHRPQKYDHDKKSFQWTKVHQYKNDEWQDPSENRHLYMDRFNKENYYNDQEQYHQEDNWNVKKEINSIKYQVQQMNNLVKQLVNRSGGFRQ